MEQALWQHTNMEIMRACVSADSKNLMEKINFVKFRGRHDALQLWARRPVEAIDVQREGQRQGEKHVYDDEGQNVQSALRQEAALDTGLLRIFFHECFQ